nr:outer membrane beta-barrel protein [Sphingomonas sp. SFZ2018-12]
MLCPRIYEEAVSANTKYLLSAGAALVAIVSGNSALAQSQARTENEIFGPFLGTNIPFQVNRGRNEGVLDRARPEYQPIGLPVSTLTLYPSLTTGIGVSDNIDGATVDRQSSVFFAIDPTVRVESNWNRHAITVNAGGAFRFFTERSARDEENLFLNADARYDLGGDSNAVTSFRVRRGYEAQFSGTFPADSVRPIEYVTATALARGVYQANRFRFTVAADATSFDFKDVEGARNTIIDQDFRDRNVYRGSGRVEYAFNPDAAAFVQASYGTTSYQRPIIGFADNRDGDSFEVLAGTTFDLAALVRATVGFGYIERSFDSPRFRDFSGFAYDVRLEYFLSPLTTITAVANRTVQDSIVAQSSGFFANTFRLRADHELLRNALLFGQVNYQINDFVALDRTDNLLEASAGGRYLVNRKLSLGASVSYLDRDSTGTAIGQRFNEYRGVVSATVHY